MGMDVYGNNPKTKTGEYFRNNVWWWRALASYILEHHYDIASKIHFPELSFDNKEDQEAFDLQKENISPEDLWHSNSGGTMNEFDTNELVKAIQNDIKTGFLSEWEENYNKWRSELPLEDCTYCNSTGIRTDAIGIQNGYHDKELSPELQILYGRQFGTCNACEGAGKTESFLVNYPFSIDNVKNFVKFLSASGGFTIC